MDGGAVKPELRNLKMMSFITAMVVDLGRKQGFKTSVAFCTNKQTIHLFKTLGYELSPKVKCSKFICRGSYPFAYIDPTSKMVCFVWQIY
jgi:hypothetical protein